MLDIERSTPTALQLIIDRNSERMNLKTKYSQPCRPTAQHSITRHPTLKRASLFIYSVLAITFLNLPSHRKDLGTQYESDKGASRGLF